jgi:hypothetical protein
VPTRRPQHHHCVFARRLLIPSSPQPLSLIWCAPSRLLRLKPVGALASQSPSVAKHAPERDTLQMELDTILNQRLTASLGNGALNMQHAMQPQHFGAPPSYLNGGHIKSENGSERGVSPHPSDSSRYSSQQPQQQLPSYPSIPQQHMNGLRYPSPSQMQAPMPMLNNSNYIPNPPDHAYAQQQQQMADAQVQHQHNGGRPASDTGPPKAFACSTCGKGFARRSDLARHGKKLGPQHQKQSTD